MMLEHYSQTKCLLVSYDERSMACSKEGSHVPRKAEHMAEASVTATDAALRAIERLRAKHGPLAFFQSGDCCDGSLPICLRDGELPPGPGDTLLGAVGGAPFYIDAEQYERWGKPHLVLDMRAGSAEEFSLSPPDTHFVTCSRRDSRQLP